MFARVTLLEIDTVRASLEETIHQFEQGVVPRLRQQPGYRGVYAFTTPEGKAMLVSLWETEAQADIDDRQTWYGDLLAEFVTLFRSPPGRERYEVSVVDVPTSVDLVGR